MSRSSKLVSVVKDASDTVFSENPRELFEVFARDEHCFFLDSGCDFGRLGRYSILGSKPETVLDSRGLEGDPLGELERMLSEKKCEPADGVPFAGGAVGYFSYGLGRATEGVRMKARDVAGFADFEFGFYDKAVVCDNLLKKVFLVACGRDERECESKVSGLCERLDRKPGVSNEFAARAGRESIESDFGKKDYFSAVGRVKEYIRSGDAYQVNLSQMFSTDFNGDSWSLYRRLRGINPAAFSAYLGFGETRVLSSSPERFLKVAGGRVETRPIKGTRARGTTGVEDKRLANELLASEKDRAEHVMIVDLERNDLGKVCEYGSVKVSEFGVLESYPTVYHLVSTVEGKLRDGVGLIDCVRATFPGGSITGAPKVRAMEIIDELEPVRRGLYTGSVGYLGFDGRMDLSIVIRTMIVKGGKLYFSVGGGVVMDSEEEAEYDETIDKARALFQSLGVMV